MKFVEDKNADLTLEQRLALSLTWQAALAVTQRLELELQEAGCEDASRTVANAVQAIRHVQRQLAEIRELIDERNTNEDIP